MEIILFEFSGAYRTAEEKSLELIQLYVAEFFHVGVGFYTFHADCHSKIVSHVRYIFDDLFVFSAFGHGLVNERVVELERICMQILNVAEI